MDFFELPQHLELIQRSEKFAQMEIIPFLNELETDIPLRMKLFQKMATEGFFTLSIDTHDTFGYCLSMIEMAKADAGIAVAMSVTNMVAEAIEKFGTFNQKERILPLLRNGQAVPAAFALTEEMAGSDVKNIQTRASVDSNKEFYILNGEKRLITNADLAGVLIVMAKSDLTSDKQGVSAFLIDGKTPGFLITKKERKLGLLTADLVSIKLDHCRIPRENLLGEEGQGTHIALSSLDRGRLGIAAQAIGIAQAAFESALHYSKTRIQFGKPLMQHEVIAFKLSDMHLKLSAAHLLLSKAAWKCDQHLPFTLEASEAKLFCSEACLEICNEALQIYGGYGYTKDYPVEKYWRDARATTIYEGTSEIQRLVISRLL